MARLVKLTATGPVKIEPSDKPVFVCACGLSKKFPAEGQTFVYDESGQRREAPKA